MLIRRKKGWELPERIATPEARYVDRRRLLAGMGIGGLILAAPAALGQLGPKSDAAWTAPHSWTRLLGFFQPVPVSAGRMPLTDRSARSGLCCRSRCEVAPRSSLYAKPRIFAAHRRGS